MEFSGTVLEKGVNEVKYWLEHNHKTMGDRDIEKAANKALSLYTKKDYRLLEDAVEDVMSTNSRAVPA